MSSLLCRSLSTASDSEDPGAGGRAEEGTVQLAGCRPGVPADGGVGGGGHPSVRHLSQRSPGLGERPDPGLPRQGVGSRQKPPQHRKE